MAVRSTMAALIARERILIHDPAGINQLFSGQDIQDVMDESRQDVFNMSMIPQPTFSGSTVSYLDYLTELGGWEDGYVIKQYLVTTVTPSVSEPIAGHWSFSASMFPPLFITGRLFDVYRSAADLLERWAAQLVLQFDFSSDGQSFRRSQQTDMLQKLANTYRMKQRPHSISAMRSDLNQGSGTVNGSPTLGPTALDYMASG